MLTLYSMLFSIQFWIALYILIVFICNNKSLEWCNRWVTIVHGIFAAVFGLAECGPCDHGLFENNHGISEKQHMILLMSFGYFVFDTFWCFYNQSESKLMMIHHLFCCYSLYRMLVKQTAGQQTVCGLGGMEVTNPMLQLRWLLRTEGYHHSSAFVITELVFFITFIIFRLVFGTYYFIAVLYLYQNDLEVRIFTLIIYVISILFVQNVISYAYKKYYLKKTERE